MKQCNGLYHWYRFLLTHKLVSIIALTLIIISSFAGSLFVSRVFPAHASNQSSGSFSSYTSAVLADQPVAYYHLDDTSGTTATDASGNNYNASYQGSSYTLNQPGIFGSGSDAAVQLAGDNGFVSTVNQGIPLMATTGNHDRTVEMWFNTSQTNGNLFATGSPGRANIFDISLVGAGGPGGCGSQASAGLYIHFWDDDLHLAGLQLADAQWHYVVVTVSNSGNTVNVFVDGKQPTAYVWNGSCYAPSAQVQPFSMPFPVNTTPTAIGIGNSHWGVGFNGSMDEVAIYSKALTATQVATHYAASGQTSTGTDPIVGDWNVTYGAPAVVTISGSSSAYTVTAKSSVRVTGSSCDLPPGTIIATFSGSGNTYSGQHGLWHTGNCSFGRWDPMSLTLSSDGNTLTGILGGGYGTVIFTKVSSTPPPNAPQFVVNNVSLAGDVLVSWKPPIDNGTLIDHYDIVEIHSDGSLGSVSASVPASQQPPWRSPRLNLCEYYRFGVSAVSVDGQHSSVSRPQSPAFTQGFPASGPPKTVVIMALGVGSHISAGQFSPLNFVSYCTSWDGIHPKTDSPAPLQDLIDQWDNQDVKNGHAPDPHGPTSFGVGNRMIDSLASTGAVVLPMSYSNGTRLTGPFDAPTFTTAGYDANAVADTRPDQVAQWLDDELVSVHTTWPNSNIIVVGHSAGGLATYLWWTQHGQYNPQGVVQAFSLDAPINGTQNDLCTHHVISFLCNHAVGIDSSLAQKVADLWNQQDQLDRKAQQIEQKSPIFTAVGTQGDAVWDFTDGNRCIQVGTQCLDYPGGDNNGLVSQVFHGDTCKQSNYTASSPKCAPGAHSIVSPCGPLDDGTHNTYGLMGTIWTHSNVKNCPGVIATIAAYDH